MLLKKICLLFFCLYVFAFATAQTAVHYKIIDVETTKPIDNATIFIPKLKLTQISDDSGYATFNIPAGAYEVEFMSSGYEKKEVQLNISVVYLDTTIIILLKPEEAILQQVTVVSTRSNNRITDEPRRVEILGQEEVNEELNIHPGNISKLLGENPGIQTQQTSVVSGNMILRLLGLNGNYTKLLKDGFPLYGGLGNDLSLLSIPPLDLQQVEIIKGASSDLYGGNAIAGIINLISKVPDMGKPALTIMLNQTLKGGSDVSAFFSHRKNHLGLTIMASATSQQAKDIDHDFFTELPHLRQFSFSPKFFYYFNDSTKLVIGVNASFERRIGGDQIAVTQHADSVHSYIEKINSNRKYSTLLFEKHLSNGVFIFKNSIGYFGRRFSVPTFDFNGTEWNTFSEGSLLKTWRQHKIVAGLDFSTDKFFEDVVTNSDSLNYTYSTFGGFIEDTWILNSYWVLQTGLRIDRHNQYGSYLLPRASLLYKPTPHWSFRAGYGRGYTIPNALNLFSLQDDLQNVYPPGKNVRSENAGSWSADILYKSHLSQEWNVSFDQSFYLTDIQRPLIPDPDSLAFNRYSFINASLPIKAKVLETNVQFSSDNLEFLIGYAYVDIRKEFDSLQHFLALTPKNKFFFSAVYELEHNFRCGVELDYIGRQYLSDGAQSKPYTLIGVMTQKSLGVFTLVANAENILNVQQIRFGTLYKGSLEHPLFTDVYAPLDGIEINFVLKINL